MFKVKVHDILTRKTFYKTFRTEHARDCFIRKSKYFKRLIVLRGSEEI